MMPLPKLKRYISIFLAVVFVVVITAYTVLVYYSLLAGIIEAATYDLRLAARDFSALYKTDSMAPLPKAPRVTAYIGETDLPVWLKDEYSPETLGHDEIELDDLEARVNGIDQEIFFFVLAHDLYDGKRLYLVKLYQEADDIPDAFRYSERTEILVVSFGIGFIVLIFLVIRFLFRKVAGSIEILSEWAGSLTREDLDLPRPGFKFREIDQLADLIQNAVGDLHEAMTREHRFLRNASHELRTPIAVLRSNMDLLNKLWPDLPDREKNIFQRMGRAVDNMHQLTETLLWLSRKEETMPEPECVDIVDLVNELVRENRFLLAGKEVSLSLDTLPSQGLFPRTACRIALGNLIRNACQYTVQGRIEIRVSPQAVSITNRSGASPNVPGSDYGFGLGLLLVDQICRKLNMSYENRPVQDGHLAELSWREIKGE